MGLTLFPLNCEVCNSRNTELIGIHVHKCNECGHKWDDPVAILSKNIFEIVKKHSCIILEKFPNFLR